MSRSRKFVCRELSRGESKSDLTRYCSALGSAGTLQPSDAFLSVTTFAMYPEPLCLNVLGARDEACQVVQLNRKGHPHIFYLHAHPCYKACEGKTAIVRRTEHDGGDQNLLTENYTTGILKWATASGCTIAFISTSDSSWRLNDNCLASRRPFSRCSSGYQCTFRRNPSYTPFAIARVDADRVLSTF
jgi:hypothetical protein